MKVPDSMIKNADPDQVAQYAGQMDPEQLAAIGAALGENVDEAHIAAVIAEVWETSLAPRLRAIRERAADEYDREQVRRYYAEELSAEEQQETFDDALRDVLVAAFSVRAAVFGEGVTMSHAVADFAALLRDPWTAEAMLLIFENDQHIDPEYSEQMKEYGAWVLRSIGVAVVPELYQPETVAEIAEDHGLEMMRHDAADRPES